MRVISGTAGGIVLKVPRTDLRPTMDRVKAAIFSSLAERLPGARVLDLFAGSGALGIEALSRGAASAAFVENNGRAVEVIKENLRRARVAGSTYEMDIFSYLDKLGGTAAFDLILADPPYAKAPGERDFSGELLACDSLYRALAPEGLFVLEKIPGAPLKTGGRWELIRERAYGATEVAFLVKASSGSKAGLNEAPA